LGSFSAGAHEVARANGGNWAFWMASHQAPEWVADWSSD
jgi:hypothetical protein